MARNKPEFPPIFPPGRHYMLLPEVCVQCVDAFPASPTRSGIFAALERLCAFLLRNGAFCELWLDGSFISTKPDPEDADLSVVIDADVFYALDASIQTNLEALLDDKNYDPLLHNFLLIRYPRSDPRRKIWEQNEAGWAEWWCVGEKSLLVRGMPVIRLGESDVGHRLLRR